MAADLDIEKFKQEIRQAKIDYDIREGQSSRIHRKRIAITLTDSYLIADGDIDEAFFFEQGLYHQLKEERLISDPIQSELDYEDTNWKKRKGWNPLKLVSQGADFYPSTKCMGKLINQVIKILKQKEARADGVQEYNSRGRPYQPVKSKQMGFKKAKGKRTTFHPISSRA